MKYITRFLLMAALALLLTSCQGEKLSDAELKTRAQNLAQEILLIDTHTDVPFRLYRHPADISRRTETGHFDYPRARAGGLDAAFMAVYVPASYMEKGGAKALSDSMIDLVEALPEKYPDKFTLATSPADIRANMGSGKIALPLGMENGSGFEGNLAYLRYFYQRGVRYVTLCHSENNRICDSSFDEERKWNGLSPFGRAVVKEMNRLGMMVDVSHVSDSAFYQVMRVSRAPVIASHSSCRYFTPGFERNMSDDMIRLLAEKGGVIQITFGAFFLESEYQQAAERQRDHIRSYLKEHHLQYRDSTARKYINQYREAHELDPGTVALVADHIDHAVKIAGVDHVGLGSDFEGVSALPAGIDDASMYPNIIFELLKRGYSEQDIRKICGENLLRVWSGVEKVAQQM